MKKLISFIITLIIITSLTVIPSHAAISEDEGIAALLKELEIMQGDENGDMMLDKKVSRAEFAKIAIAASPEKNSVAVGLKQSPFKDVPYTTWYAPYVKAAVSAGYVMGYLDATFRPENTVTYEEAATIMLRVLGYDDTTFGDAYPYGQLSKANSLSILDNVQAVTGEELTRREVMQIVYNSLKANTNSASKLIALHDCTMSDNVDIIAVADQQNNLGSNEILTSAGTYTTGEHFNEQSVGMTGTVFIKDSKDIIAFVPDTENPYIDYETYFVYSVLSNYTIVGYKNGRFEKIDIPQNGTFYQDYYGTTRSDEYQNSNNVTSAPISTRLYMGDILYVKRKDNGTVDYYTYAHHELNGPVKVTSENWLAQVGANESSRVFRNGSESGISAVQTNDIVYYSEPIDVAFVYTDKVTGIYESAAPNKDTPKSVVVSGKTYNIESADAFYDLSSSGGYKYGDTVTLLLGKEGEVAGIAGTGSASASSTGAVSWGVTAGYVIESGKKDFTSADNTVHSSYYVRVVSTDGTETEYQTKSNYSSLVCSVVRVTFKDGLATLSKTKEDEKISGIFSSSRGIIGNNLLADNVNILDTIGSYNSDTPAYCKIFPQRLDGITINSGDVLYYSKNSAGEIDNLILKDVTGDTYTYGIVISASKAGIVMSPVTEKVITTETNTTIETDEKGEEKQISSKTNTTESNMKVGVESISYSGSYTIDINGTQSLYGTNLAYTVKGPARLIIKNGSVESARALTSYSQRISKLTHTEAEIGDKTYLLSDNVVVYRRTDDYKYLKISLDEAINGDYRMTAFYDKAQSSGGRIRIIIAQNN